MSSSSASSAKPYTRRTPPSCRTGAFRLVGDLREILIFDRLLTDEERAEVDAYLAR